MNADEKSEGTSQFHRNGIVLVLLAAAPVLIVVLTSRLWTTDPDKAAKSLLTAAAQGDAAAAAKAIAAGADLSATDARGYSALGYAAENSDLPLLDLLLDAGADPNGAIRAGAAAHALEIAVRRDDRVVARRLLDAGADPSVFIKGGSSPYPPPLLRFCIENGRMAMMELLLDSGADVERSARLTTQKLVMDGPPLFAAISSNQPPDVRLQMVRILIKHGANVRAEVGRRNAMDLAVFDSDSQVGDLLRQYGAEYGPREMAAFNRLDELKQVVKQRPSVLKERFRPTWAADPGQNPTLLGFALERGHRETAKFLIESGAPLNTIENLGATPLHKAARGGDPELIKLLVARGLNVNAKDKYQDTPLTDILWRGKAEAIAALIQAGADVNTRGMNGHTALHSAVSSNRVEVVRMLLAAGADPTIRNGDGETVLDRAIETAPDEWRPTPSGQQRPLPKVKSEIVQLLKQAASSKQGGQSTKAGRKE